MRNEQIEIATFNRDGLPEQCIATVHALNRCAGDEQTERQKSNARLIAACPELLALVEIMRDAMNRGGEFQLGPKGRHAGLRERVQAVLSQVNP